MTTSTHPIRGLVLSASIALIFMFFLNVFDSTMPVAQRVVVGFLCVLYGLAPVYIRMNTSLEIDLDDKRNVVILSVAGLFLLGAVYSGIAYGLLSMEMLIAAVTGFGVFIGAIMLVRYSALEQ